MNVRLVHLLDDAKRKELMLIYAEDLAPSGHTARIEGRERRGARWEAMKVDLMKRALENFPHQT